MVNDADLINFCIRDCNGGNKCTSFYLYVFLFRPLLLTNQFSPHHHHSNLSLFKSQKSPTHPPRTKKKRKLHTCALTTANTTYTLNTPIRQTLVVTTAHRKIITPRSPVFYFYHAAPAHPVAGNYPSSLRAKTTLASERESAKKRARDSSFVSGRGFCSVIRRRCRCEIENYRHSGHVCARQSSSLLRLFPARELRSAGSLLSLCKFNGCVCSALGFFLLYFI